MCWCEPEYTKSGFKTPLQGKIQAQDSAPPKERKTAGRERYAAAAQRGSGATAQQGKENHLVRAVSHLSPSRSPLHRRRRCCAVQDRPRVLFGAVSQAAAESGVVFCVVAEPSLPVGDISNLSPVCSRPLRPPQPVARGAGSAALALRPGEAAAAPGAAVSPSVSLYFIQSAQDSYSLQSHTHTLSPLSFITSQSPLPLLVLSGPYS